MSCVYHIQFSIPPIILFNPMSCPYVMSVSMSHHHTMSCPPPTHTCIRMQPSWMDWIDGSRAFAHSCTMSRDPCMCPECVMIHMSVASCRVMIRILDHDPWMSIPWMSILIYVHMHVEYNPMSCHPSTSWSNGARTSSNNNNNNNNSSVKMCFTYWFMIWYDMIWCVSA